jgi:hypothetical protein
MYQKVDHYANPATRHTSLNILAELIAPLDVKALAALLLAGGKCIGLMVLLECLEFRNAIIPLPETWRKSLLHWDSLQKPN